MKTPSLPPAQARKLTFVRAALETKRRFHGEFRGKQFRCAPNMVSVPLGRRWRAIFQRTSAGYHFRGCFTHERYNKLNPSTFRYEN